MVNLERSVLIFWPVKLIVSSSPHNFPAKLYPRNTIYFLSMLFSAAC